jgi:protein-S-isoprenylcysteine O-methyltransferase Ste14
MSDGFVQRGGLWVVGQFALLIAIGILGITCRANSEIPAIFIAAMVLFIVSAIYGITGLLALGRNLTPFPKPSTRTRFVEHGIYCLIRHLLYTSVFCAALGWSLVWQSWPAFAVSLILGVHLDAKARHEERWLRERFADYAAYEQ